MQSKKGLVVLSLFDGVSCGRVALERAGLKVDKYYASEINKYAIKVSENNYPDIIRLGDVTSWAFWDNLYNIDFAKIDLLMAGFPCQPWSVAGKQKGLDDKRGQLSKVLYDIFAYIKTKNPNLLFLFENVRMKKENLDFFDDLFGVNHIMINSSLVSAQNRLRAYWTNISGVEQPKDKGIILEDIVHENIDIQSSSCNKNNKSHTLTASYNGAVWWNSIDKRQRTMLFEELNSYIVPFDKTLQILDKEVKRGKVGYFRTDAQANRVYYIHDKAVTLCGDAGGGAAKMGQYLFGCITPDSFNSRQNGQRFNEGKKFYTLTAQDKHGILIEGYIRKLTPVECERLQTLEDGYTNGISKSQRYKALGNGWTVDVISHILKSVDMYKKV